MTMVVEVGIGEGGQVRAKVYAGWTAGRGGGAIAVIREERLG
jgi:hypothetical protein